MKFQFPHGIANEGVTKTGTIPCQESHEYGRKSEKEIAIAKHSMAELWKLAIKMKKCLYHYKMVVRLKGKSCLFLLNETEYIAGK